MFGLLHEYSNLEYVHMYVTYRITQAEYATRILMAASQEYVNTYSTPRSQTHKPAEARLISGGWVG